MRKKIFIFLIPLLIILLILGGAFVYLKISTTPKKIFEKATTQMFDKIEEKQVDYTSLNGKVELYAKIESDDEDLKEIKDILDTSAISLETQIDMKKAFINEKIGMTYDDEAVLNAELLVQDEKIYIALKDWLDRYIELPEENYNVSEIENVFEDASTVNKMLLLETLKQELVNALSKQSFSKETVTMNLNGKNSKVTKSSLKLNETQAIDLTKELLMALKNNNDFLTAIGKYKEVFLNNADNISKIGETDNGYSDSNSAITISIYTKGLLSKFVAVDLVASDDAKELGGIAFIKASKEKFECYFYNNENEERKYPVRISGEEKNGQGKVTLIITNDEEETELLCNYNKSGNKTSYDISTEIDEIKLNISGSVITEGTRYSGNAMFTIETSEIGTIKLSCLYSLEYNAPIEKVNISNVVLLDEMTEEDQNKLVTNIQNSKLYELMSEKGWFGQTNAISNEIIDKGQSEEAVVELDSYSIKFNVPEEFDLVQFDSTMLDRYKNSRKDYDYDVFNGVKVYIQKQNADKFLDNLSNDIILEVPFYENQNITDISEYEFNNIKYKFRAITYNYSNKEKMNLYFVCELDSETSYVVQVEMEDENIHLEDINYFLDIVVEDGTEGNNIHLEDRNSSLYQVVY